MLRPPMCLNLALIISWTPEAHEGGEILLGLELQISPFFYHKNADVCVQI